MLEARSVAIVGASARPDSFGARMLAEAAKSPAQPVIYPVNPRYSQVEGRQCYPALADLPGPVDLVLLGVPDAALEAQLTLAAELGCRSGVIFGNAYSEPPPGNGVPPQGDSTARRGGTLVSPQQHQSAPAAPGFAPLRPRLAAIARAAGMELCGAGCMGFANVSYGLRAMGYVEPDPLPAGPVALVTHSGSVFSMLLRTRRAFGYTLAVSAGQELVTAAPSYLSYALDQPETKVLALVMEAMREPDRLRAVLEAAAGRDVPVVLLTAGNSASGRAMVAAHSGALAGSGAGWEALAAAYGVHRVADLAELADTLELFSLLTKRRPTGARPLPARPRPARPLSPGHGIATVHDSGLERAHTADVADELGVPFAAISDSTKARLADLLDPGLAPANPLDVWGTGASTRELFGGCLAALAADDSVGVVALAIDLVKELDGDESYQLALLDVAAQTDKPLVVIANVPAAIDQETAALLRGSAIGVLEGMRPGLLAVRHLLTHLAGRPERSAAQPVTDPARLDRLDRARPLLRASPASGAAQLALLAEYGIPVARAVRVSAAAEAAAAAASIGYPVVLKTDEPSIAHKSDVGGVALGIADEPALRAAYADLASRLGPAALICETAPRGVELALGVVTDPDLGPLIVVGAGGTLVELIADRAVALPPITLAGAMSLLSGLKISKLLSGLRGAPPANLDAIARAITALGTLAADLGPDLDALDINPLICTPTGAVAVDALVIPRAGAS
jgi:acetate---CoA ligase (ADP-forming)